MKTPEEIKKGLGSCSPENGFAPFYNNFSCKKKKWCADMGNVDALAYIQRLESDNASKDERIQMLEAGMAQWEDVAESPGAVEDMARENYRLTQELAAVKRERDAAVRDLNLTTPCDVCMNNEECPGWPIFNPCQWQWRGVCPENAEVKDED